MLYESIKNYQPINAQEVEDQKMMLRCIQETKDVLYRSSSAYHMTSSCFIVNSDMTKLLFGYHHIYDSWAWLGGHADGDPHLLEVALKEAREESGLTHISPVIEDIFTLDVILVHNHIKHGQYISDHLHLNASFLLVADENEHLQRNPEEHQDLRWFDIDDIFEFVTEPRMIPVYEKAIKRIKDIRHKL